MQCNIPSNPNPFLTHWLLSPNCAQVMREAGGNVRDMYRAVVAKDTAALAESARVDLGIGGQKNDRIVADVSAGRDLPRGYGATHEFGRKRQVEGPSQSDDGQPVRTGGHHAAHDFVRVLQIITAMQ